MIGPFEQVLSAIVVFFVMLGMGASLTTQDFKAAASKPQGVAIGLACQFGIMPLIGFCLVAVLPMSSAVAVGVMIMACMPGGTTSNMFTYFARGNLALSVMMTVASTAFGVVLIPLLLGFYAGLFDLAIPHKNIVIALLIVMVPVMIGMGVRRASPKFGALTEKIGSWLAIGFIAFLVASWVPRNATFLMETSTTTYIAAITLGLFGIIFGYGAALLCRLDRRDSRTVAIETGLQNGPLAFGIIAFTFSGELQQSYVAVPALYSVFIVVIASLVTLVFRALDARPTAAIQTP